MDYSKLNNIHVACMHNIIASIIYYVIPPTFYENVLVSLFLFQPAVILKLDPHLVTAAPLLLVAAIGT